MAAKAIHAYLSAEAHEGWHELAAHSGASVSAILEVMGQDWLALLDRGDLESGLDSEMVAKAQAIDTNRRRRRSR